MKKIICLILSVLMLLSLSACGGGEDTTGTTAPAAPKELNLTETYTTITSGVTMPGMLQLDSDLMLDLFGIKAEDCKQALVYICENSLQADEIWMIEAKDAAALETLKTLAQSRLDQKDAESITYSPEQNKVVKKTQIIVTGNYLVMICSPDVEAIATAFLTAAGI